MFFNKLLLCTYFYYNWVFNTTNICIFIVKNHKNHKILSKNDKNCLFLVKYNYICTRGNSSM